TGWNNLGNVYQNRYQRYQLQSNLAKKEGDDQEVARLWGLAKQDEKAAPDAYERSLQASVALGGMSQAKALLNLARFLQLQESPQQKLIQQYRQKAMEIIQKLPDSRAKAYALINLAQSQEEKTSKEQNLVDAIATAGNIKDSRAESFALTALG
ncbi:hypothetical protein, partial [Salmonella enterica]|uniref:hypothetical protein n=1 Tax=Salmonella enterica TaxID=28901 RepID=UPI000B24F5F0